MKGIELADERIDGYVRALADLSEAQIGYAFGRALRELTFFPQVAELRSFAVECLRTPEAIAAREKRNKELDDALHRKYKQARLSGYQPKMLPSLQEPRQKQEASQ